ncbi:uncharacterized protein LOC135171334 [Diachasmimorpha longicaudata]|uniref:uncharacterized protein LOC135171334 n=1 Tax=Diachasmimorpha longicaudata TaxID=58733 RepID=UPI0030B8DCFD
MKIHLEAHPPGACGLAVVEADVTEQFSRIRGLPRSLVQELNGIFFLRCSSPVTAGGAPNHPSDSSGKGEEKYLRKWRTLESQVTLSPSGYQDVGLNSAQLCIRKEVRSPDLGPRSAEVQQVDVDDTGGPRGRGRNESNSTKLERSDVSASGRERP